MPARLSAALAAGLLIAAGCGGDAAVREGDASRIVLQLADLGRGYERFDGGRLTAVDAQPGRTDPMRFGRRGGWKARYRRRAEGDGPPLVESRVDVFADEDGAGRDLRAYAENPLRLRAARQPDVGEDAVALERGGTVAVAVVAWRTANATASVTVTGAGADLADAERLAREQERRMVHSASR